MKSDDEIIRRGDVIAEVAKLQRRKLVHETGYQSTMCVREDGRWLSALDVAAAISAVPAAPAIPGARWRERGETDPHGDRYDCERAALTMGNMTDDELANGVYMAGREDLDLIIWQDAAKDRIRWLSRSLAKALGLQTFQSRVQEWMLACFGSKISSDRLERGDRLLEEVFELLQSGGYPRERAAALEQYVWSRDIGDPAQEVGGVMTTLASYCLAHGLDMHGAAETELARVWTKIDKIRAKQATKPTGSALPQVVRAPVAPEVSALVEAVRTVRGAVDRILQGQPVRNLDEALSAIDAALAALEGTR